jgi:hypothetical protein
VEMPRQMLFLREGGKEKEKEFEKFVVYLYPSIEQAKIYLTETNKKDWIDEISLMIYWHHKMTNTKVHMREL